MAAATKANLVKEVVDTAGWLTRTQAIDLLGVSMSSLTRWEREGILHVQFATRGNFRQVAVIDPNELCRVPRRHRTPIPNEAGELTARVFEALDDGKSVREIVIQVRDTVVKVEELKEQWLDTGGADLVVAKAAKERLEALFGPFKTVSELVDLATAKLAEKEAT